MCVDVIFFPSWFVLAQFRLETANLSHDVTCSWIHPLSGFLNIHHLQGFLCHNNISQRFLCRFWFVTRWILSSVMRTNLKICTFYLLSMQYIVVRHQYCCCPYYRTHTVSICWLFCSLFVNTVCKSMFEWQLR